MRFRSALFLSFGLPALLLFLASAFGQQRDIQGRNVQPQTPTQKTGRTIEQSFPPNGLMETAWKIEWDTMAGNGLFIRSAHFKRGPKHEWMQVLGDCRISELLVPYHAGDPRFWDVSYGFSMTNMTAADAGERGKLHISNNGRGEGPCVVEELRDRGVIWKSSNGVRRGHVLVLWGCLEASNYRYIIEYGFQDDGSVTFRLGSTGHNYPSRETTPHMHNTFWRVDVNLGDKDHNTVQMMEHIEPLENRLHAKTVHSSFNNGKEGGADWDASKFSMLRVINTQKKNLRGEYNAYDLVVSRMGNSRHFAKDEDCTQHDFWVTKVNPKEMNIKNIKKYCNGENIEDTDVVIWYSAPCHHEPRSEDGIMSDGQIRGATHVAWSGFTLRPSNIFDETPLFPYTSDAPTKGKGKGKKGG